MTRPAPAATGIFDLLADTRLLPESSFDELVRDVLPRCDDWRIVGPELVYRGWLTPFQALMLHRGRGRELLLGSYVLREALGEGGMGHLYRARNWKLEIDVALKVIRQDRAGDPGAAGRFLREVRALGAIDHPNIVRAVDARRRRRAPSTAPWNMCRGPTWAGCSAIGGLCPSRRSVGTRPNWRPPSTTSPAWGLFTGT